MARTPTASARVRMVIGIPTRTQAPNEQDQQGPIDFAVDALRPDAASNEQKRTGAERHTGHVHPKREQHDGHDRRQH